MSAGKPVATAGTLAGLRGSPLIIDVRDQNEIAAGKGGPPAFIPGSLNVPLNHLGVPQSQVSLVVTSPVKACHAMHCTGVHRLLQRPTTSAEFREKLVAAGVELPADRSAPIICHCGSGGRGGRAALFLEELGYLNVHNGGGPSHIAQSNPLLVQCE